MIVKIIPASEAMKVIGEHESISSLPEWVRYVGGYKGDEILAVMPFYKKDGDTETHIYSIGGINLIRFAKVALSFMPKPVIAKIRKGDRVMSLAKYTGFKQFGTINDNILMRLS